MIFFRSKPFARSRFARRGFCISDSQKCHAKLSVLFCNPICLLLNSDFLAIVFDDSGRRNVYVESLSLFQWYLLRFHTMNEVPRKKKSHLFKIIPELKYKLSSCASPRNKRPKREFSSYFTRM